MKRLFFLAVLLGTLILSGIFAFSYWRLKTRTPQAYFELGKTYYEQGKLRDATIQFMNALRRDGSHRDSRFYLARCYLDQKDPMSAYRQFKAILDVDPDDVEANLQVSSLFLSAGPTNPENYREALRIAQVVLEKDDKNVRAWVLKGNAETGLAEKGDFSEALKSLEKAIALEPGNVSAWISLGGMRVQQKNFSQAEEAFLKARAADTSDKSAITSLANFYRAAGNSEKAESVFRSALSEYPADREIYSQAVDFYVRNRRFADAETILKAAQAANAGDPSPTLDLVELYKLQKRDDEARNLLLDAKEKFPKSIPVSVQLASSLIPSKLDQAQKEIDQILKAEPNNIQGLVLRGQLEFASGRFDKAADTLGKEPALGSAYPQVHYLLGNIALKKGKIDEAQDHFQRSIRLDKGYLPARIALANVFLIKGNVPETRQEVRQILELDPGNMSGRLLKAMIETVDKSNPAVEADYASLATEFPNNAEIHRQMGIYMVSRGKTAAAEKSFSRAVELEPNEQNLRDLTQLSLLTNQVDRARQRLDAIPDTEKQAFHYELMGMIAEQERKLQDAEIAYKKALDKDPNRLNTESLLFNLYLRADRLNDAVSQLDGLEKKMPSNAMVRAMKGAVKEMQGNREVDRQRAADLLEKAKRDYEGALQADPTLDFAANNLAYLLAEEGRDLQTALDLAEGVRRRQPQNPAVADTLGWIYYKQDSLALAKGQAEFAVSMQPENGVFQYHLGEIYRKSPSQIPKAVVALKKAVASPTNFKEKELAQAALKDLQKRPTPPKQ